MHRKSILIIPTHIGTKEDKTNNMAQNEQTNYVAEAKRSEYGFAAALLAQQGDNEGAEAALKRIPYQTSDPLTREMLETFQDTPEAVRNFIPRAARYYQRAVANTSVTSMFGLYDSVAKDLSGPAQEKLGAYLTKNYGDKTIGQVDKELRKAKNVLDAPDDYTPEEVKAAQATMQKHQVFNIIKSNLSQPYYGALTLGVQRGESLKGLEGLATKLN